MTMAKIISGNDNDSTNEQVKSLSFSKRQRQQLQNINNSSNNALLFTLELNRCAGEKDIVHFCKDRNTLHQSESNLNGLSSRMECGLKIGIFSVT